jgi:hypothetical protein
VALAEAVTMKALLEPIVELLAYAVAAVGLTAAGVIAELTSINYLSAGNLTFAVWLAVMGAVALYAGVVALGIEEVLPRLQSVDGDL